MSDIDLTQFRPIPGFEEIYSIREDGAIYSHPRNVKHGKANKDWGGYLLKASPNKQNHYPYVSLRRDGITRRFTVHSLVALAFIGPRPEGMEVCHWDGDRSNPSLSNLRYGTHSSNMLDTNRHGTHKGRWQAGERHPTAKLTAEQVQAIRLDTRRHREIAKDYGISKGYVSVVKAKTWWKHLDASQ